MQPCAPDKQACEGKESVAACILAGTLPSWGAARTGPAAASLHRRTCEHPSSGGRCRGTAGRCLAGTGRRGWRPQQCAAARRRLRGRQGGGGRRQRARSRWPGTRSRQQQIIAVPDTGAHAPVWPGVLGLPQGPPPHDSATTSTGSARTRVRDAAAVMRDVHAAHNQRVAWLQAVQVPAMPHAEGQHGRLGRRRCRCCRCTELAGTR